MATAEQKIENQRTGARPDDPCALVIFGADGDLTKRLLVPSLYNLRSSNLVPENFAVVEVSAAKFSDEEFREKLTRDIQEFARSPVEKELWESFVPKIYYISFDSEAVRDEKAKVLLAIQPLSPEDVFTKAVRGQYGPGILLDKPVPGYRAEPQVEPQSTTETFVAMELYIDNWRWAGVPFYLRTGKRLAQREYKSGPWSHLEQRPC
jgi:glucose-6-phosphate 1-dehydrogenase